MPVAAWIGMANGISGRNQFSFRFSSPKWSSAMKIFKAAGRRLKSSGLAVMASDPDKRAALAAALDGFERDFLDDFYWAIGLQSPRMLHALMMALNGHADRKTNPSHGRCSDSLTAEERTLGPIKQYTQFL
jgi:hypothetical protein